MRAELGLSAVSLRSVDAHLLSLLTLRASFAPPLLQCPNTLCGDGARGEDFNLREFTGFCSLGLIGCVSVWGKGGKDGIASAPKSCVVSREVVSVTDDVRGCHQGAHRCLSR